MAEFEGWHPGGISSNQGGDPSASYRNHNPGNLRWSLFQLGQRKGFAYFQDDATGMFAMRFDVMWKCQGKTSLGLTGESTLTDLIKIYAAASGETLNNYVNFICDRTGFKPDTKLKVFVQ